eukprot:274217-Chlamydomonas_euryale.AAC.11
MAPLGSWSARTRAACRRPPPPAAARPATAPAGVAVHTLTARPGTAAADRAARSCAWADRHGADVCVGEGGLFGGLEAEMGRQKNECTGDGAQNDDPDLPTAACHLA